MKTLLFLLLATCSFAQDVASYSAQAVKLYPELGVAGSPFNQKFLAAVQKAKNDSDPMLQSINWPMRIAKQVAEEMGENPITPTMGGGSGGLQKFLKLTVDQVAANPFTMQGALIELTGISKSEIQEVEKGVYEVTIWGENGGYLTATCPQQQAGIAEQAKCLYVSVDQPAKLHTKILLHGTRVMYQALSTLPTAIW